MRCTHITQLLMSGKWDDSEGIIKAGKKRPGLKWTHPEKDAAERISDCGG